MAVATQAPEMTLEQQFQQEVMAREMMLQQQQMGVPAPLDPAVDLIIAQNYDGPSAALGAVGGAAKIGSTAFLTKWAAENILPSFFSNVPKDKVGRDAAEATRKAVMDLKVDDIYGFNDEAKEAIKKAQDFLSNNPFRRGNEAAVSEQLRNVQDAVKTALETNAGYVTANLNNATININNANVRIDGITETLEKAGVGVTVAWNGVTNIVNTAKETGTSVDIDVTQKAIGASLCSVQDVLNDRNIADAAKQTMGAARDSASHASANFNATQVQHEILDHLGKASEAVKDKARSFTQLDKRVQIVLTGVVAAAVVFGAYKGWESAQQNKRNHEELQATAAGMQQHYAGLYNEAGAMADMNRAMMMEQSFAAPSYDALAVNRARLEQNVIDVPYSVVKEPTQAGRMMGGQSQVMLPPSSASRAEMIEFQKQQAAAQQDGSVLLG